MWISDQWKDYEVLDASDGEKLERWGSYYLVRPDPQVIWSTPRTDPHWKTCDARYARPSTGGGAWENRKLPESAVQNGWKIALYIMTASGTLSALKKMCPRQIRKNVRAVWKIL